MWFLLQQLGNRLGKLLDWYDLIATRLISWIEPSVIYIFTYIVDPPINAFRFVICHSIWQPFGVQHVACASGAYWKTITTLNQRQVGRLRRKKKRGTHKISNRSESRVPRIREDYDRGQFRTQTTLPFICSSVHLWIMQRENKQMILNETQTHWGKNKRKVNAQLSVAPAGKLGHHQSKFWSPA